MDEVTGSAPERAPDAEAPSLGDAPSDAGCSEDAAVSDERSDEGGSEDEDSAAESDAWEGDDDTWTWTSGWRWPWQRGTSEEEALSAEMAAEQAMRAAEAAAAREEAAARDAAIGRREELGGGGGNETSAMGPTAAGSTHESRAAKAAERDMAVTRILAARPRDLKGALRLGVLATEAEVGKRVKTLLRLLHPDFGINQQLKGTKKGARIDAAFKKLNELRTVARR